MIGEIKKTRKLGDDGEWIVTEHYFLDREEVSEAEYRKAIPEKAGVPLFATGITMANPLKSDALAVHPEQIPAAVARNKRHGLEGLAYDRHGRPVFTDSGMRKRLMQIEGVRARNSAYGY